MYLLECCNGSIQLTEYLLDHEIPPYAILSHTWGHPRDEVTYKDMVEGTGQQKAGYKKIEFCSEQTVRDGLQYFWIDTCCINRAYGPELQEAVTSMFHWYQRAKKCYAYLADVYTRNPDARWSWEQGFRQSRWFTRGWTLQELLAPDTIEFFSQEGSKLGNKRNLEDLVHNITAIPIRALQGAPMSQFDLKERLLWARFRHTAREEDEVYSLFGILEIFMPIIYGEGRESARARLSREMNQALGQKHSIEIQQKHDSKESTAKIQQKHDSKENTAKISWIKLQTLKGNLSPIGSVAFSSDSRWLASAFENGNIQVWDVGTGAALHTLEGHSNFVFSIDFSSDGRWLASASYDQRLRLWDVTTGKVSLTFTGHEDWFFSVAFSPDGRQLASGSYDTTIVLWDIATGGVLQRLEGHNASVTSVTFSSDGRQLASGSNDGTIQLWDVSTLKMLRKLEGHRGGVTCVTFSPDDKQLASASQDLTVKIWDATIGNNLVTLRGHTRFVTSVTFSPDGRQLASGSFDTCIRLWNVSTWEILRELEGHSDWVISVAFSPDGKRLASVSNDLTMRLWDVSPVD